MKRALMSLKNFLFDLVLPPLCAHCKIFLTERAILCNRCLLTISPITSVSIDISSRYSMKVFAISDYKDPIKSLILAKSSSNIIASNQLGHLIWELTHIRSISFDYIIPIPLHWTRYAKRGFNQAQEIAHVLSENSTKPVTHIIRRVKRTSFQSKLIVEARIGNVADAFELRKTSNQHFEGKDLLLIDDLSTTGSTLKFAARELIKLKPASITAVVAARVV